MRKPAHLRVNHDSTRGWPHLGLLTLPTAGEQEQVRGAREERCNALVCMSNHLKVLPWVVDGAGGLGAGKTSGAGTRGVDLNAAIGGRTGDSNTNGGESSNN